MGVLKAAKATKKLEESKKAKVGSAVSEALGAMKSKAAAKKAAVAEIGGLIKAGEWGELKQRAKETQKAVFTHYVKGMSDGLRGEHTVIAMLYPLDVDTSGRNLTDTQMTQIFWNELSVELVMLAVIYSPPSGTSSGFNLIFAIMDAALVVGPVTIGAIIFRQIFKWGNRAKRQRVKRERAVAANETVATASKGAERGGGRKSKESSASFSRRRWLRKARGDAQWALAWIIVYGTNVTLLLILMIFASQTFGPEGTNGFLLSWMTAAALAWLVVEPLEVVAIVFLPFILDNKYVANTRFALKELGIL